MKEVIEQLLNLLGDSPEQVMESLKERGFRNEKSYAARSRTCPVARYLRAETQEPLRVAAGDSTVSILHEAAEYVIPNPVVAKAIHNFDRELWSQLLKPGF